MLPVRVPALGSRTKCLDPVIRTPQTPRGLLPTLTEAIAVCGPPLQSGKLRFLLPSQPLVMVVGLPVRKGEREVDAHIDANLRTGVRLGPGFQGLDTESNVPAEHVLDQPGSGDPVVVTGALADRELLGPAKPDTADLGDVDQAPTAVNTDDMQVPTLRNVHRHHRAESGLEVRRIRPAVPAVLPRLEVRLQHRLRGLRGQDTEPFDVLAALPDRRISSRQRALGLGDHRPPVVQQVPHRPGSVCLIVNEPNLHRRQRESGPMPELTLDHRTFTHTSKLDHTGKPMTTIPQID